MFDAPSPNWNRGHRGVDLAGVPDQPVYAAGAGTVVFAGELAGRPLVSIAHPGGLRTSYEPVRPRCGPGTSVDAGAAIGELVAGHPRLPGAGLPALGRDVGPGRARTTSTRWACWRPRRSGSNRCTVADYAGDCRDTPT